jgi:hypothetical protein
MKRLMTVAGFAALLALRVGVSAAPTPDQLLQKWIESIGGRAALEKITTRTASGTLEMPALGINADFVYKAKAPALRLTEVTVPNFGVVREGYDGKLAWTINPAMGNTEKSGKELARAKREAVFHRELDFKKLFPKLEVTGSTQVKGQEAWILKATTADDDVETFTFDAKSGLLLRQQATVETPNGTVQTDAYIEDYREVDGLKVAHFVRMVSPPEMAFELKFKEYVHNKAIPDSEFQRPAN